MVGRAQVRGGLVCPNGIIIWSGSGTCPNIQGWVNGGTSVSHFTASGIGNSSGDSTCSATQPTWQISYGSLLEPNLDGTYFGIAASYKAYGMPRASITPSVTWTNVSPTDTTFMYTILQGWRYADGATTVDQNSYQEYAYVSGVNVIPQNSTTGTMSVNWQGQPRGPNEAFFAGGVACNSVASGLGPPVLSKLEVRSSAL